MSRKRLAGWLLLLAVFGGLVAATTARLGWPVALVAFGWAVVIPALICLAIWLIVE